MNFNLEQLWYSYLNQYPYENNEEIIKLRDDLLLKEQQLRADFSEDQTRLFFCNNESQGMLEIVKEREAFIKGIKLAVQFMLESLSCYCTRGKTAGASPRPTVSEAMAVVTQNEIHSPTKFPQPLAISAILC